MPTIEDKEFGTVTIRKVASSRSMKATVAPNGTLRISVPSYAPLFMIKRMIAGSRSELRRLMDSRPVITIVDGMQIGKSHTLLFRRGSELSIRRSGNHLTVTLAPDDTPGDTDVVS